MLLGGDLMLKTSCLMKSGEFVCSTAWFSTCLDQ